MGGGTMSEFKPNPGANQITDNPDVQKRMAELGQRYLERTVGELGQLQTFIEEVSHGDADSLKNIEVLAHRIRGSGAMFGFDLMSDVAGEIELLAADAKLGLQLDRQALHMRLAAMLRVLTFVLDAARR